MCDKKEPTFAHLASECDSCRNRGKLRVSSIQCIADLDIILLASTWPSYHKHPLTDSNADAGQEHTGTLLTRTHMWKLHTNNPQKNMKLVLKFVSTPAAHTLRFTLTVSKLWHKQAYPEDIVKQWCCFLERPPRSCCAWTWVIFCFVWFLFCLLLHFSPQALGTNGF